MHSIFFRFFKVYSFHFFSKKQILIPFIYEVSKEVLYSNYIYIYIYVRTRFESLAQTMNGPRPKKPKTMNL